MSHHRYIVAIVTFSVWAGLCRTGRGQTDVTFQAGVVGQANVAVDRDPDDARERFLLLAPGGPLVVEFSITINGLPFRKAREKLIDELLAQLVKDDEKEITWSNATAGSRSPLRPFYPRGPNSSTGTQLSKQFDVNKNGLVDRTELRQLVARNNGDAFTVRGNAVGGIGAVVLDDLLDADHDQVLSREEIRAVAERLKSRDEDDNDLISVAEVGGQAPGMYRPVNPNTMRQAANLALLLGSAADLQFIHKAIQEKYRDKAGKLRADCFPLLPKLVATLDRNDNGEFDADEVAGLNSLSPHLTCEINLGDVGKRAPGLTIKSLAPEWGSVDDLVSRSGDTVTLKLPSLALSVTRNNSVAPTNYEPLAKNMLDRYDANKNGYIEKDEVSGVQGLAQQFDVWDADADDKVYAKEIISAYERQTAPISTQVVTAVADQGTALFSALDLSGDRRLGLREMRTAAKQLKTFDADGDGRITRNEIPRQLAITVGRGNSTVGATGTLVLSSVGATSAAATKTNSDWFSSMDRNGDGDVSEREFLGTSEQFLKLDTDGDGLIARAEADAVKP